MSTERKQPEWLAEHYDKQKARSAAIVEQAIIDLIVSGEKVTEESVVSRSKIIDPDGRGVSRSTLRRNPACQKRFVLARGGQVKARKATAIRAFFAAAERNGQDDASQKARARRLLRLRKDELVTQLLALEQRVKALENSGYVHGEAEFERVMTCIDDI